MSFDPITITNGVRKCRAVIYPVVLGCDIKIKVDESKWANFGALSKEEMDAVESKEISNNSLGRKYILLQRWLY